jgi:putative hemolysin
MKEKNMFRLYRTTQFLAGILMLVCLVLVSCANPTSEPAVTVQPSDSAQPNMPNPASVYCEQQGYKVEIRTAADGSQSGICIFSNGSECDEWAFYRGECAPLSQPAPTPTPLSPTGVPLDIPTAMPINPADYQGWLTYTNPDYGFSFMFPEDWTVEEAAASDALLGGHLLNIHPSDETATQNIRLTFRKVGEDTLLWPTGVGQGSFSSPPDSTLEIAGQPAQRVLLVCPAGEVTAIWYHQAKDQPNIARGDLEFGTIFTAGEHCLAGASLEGKTQLTGEMIIASLQVP